MAKKKYHKKRKYSVNPVSRKHYRKTGKRRHYRRNPASRGVRGFTGLLMTGVFDAGEVVLGRAGARIVPALFGFPVGTGMNLIGQAVTAVLVGWVGHQFISANAGKMMLAGGLASPVEDLIKGMNIPIISAALGESELQEISAYPSGSMEAYPMASIGEEEEDESLVY